MGKVGCLILGALFVFWTATAILVFQPSTGQDVIECILLGGLATFVTSMLGMYFSGIGRGDTEV